MSRLLWDWRNFQHLLQSISVFIWLTRFCYLYPPLCFLCFSLGWREEAASASLDTNRCQIVWCRYAGTSNSSSSLLNSKWKHSHFFPFPADHKMLAQHTTTSLLLAGLPLTYRPTSQCCLARLWALWSERTYLCHLYCQMFKNKQVIVNQSYDNKPNIGLDLF